MTLLIFAALLVGLPDPTSSIPMTEPGAQVWDSLSTPQKLEFAQALKGYGDCWQQAIVSVADQHLPRTEAQKILQGACLVAEAKWRSAWLKAATAAGLNRSESEKEVDESLRFHRDSLIASYEDEAKMIRGQE